MKQIRKRLTYANVMSSIAVFLVLGGATAFAASQLGKNTVGTKQLKKNAVTKAKIKNGAVNGAKIADGSVTGPKLADGAVGEAKLGTDAVTEAKIKGGAVTGAKLGDGSVSTGKLQNGAVTGEKIAQGAITGEDIAPGSTPFGEVVAQLRNDGPVNMMTGSATLIGTDVQPPNEDDIFFAGLNVTFQASCTTPRSAIAYLLLDNPIPGAENIIGIGQAADTIGGTLTKRLDIGPFPGIGAGMQKMGAGFPQNRTFFIYTGGSCNSGTGIAATNLGVDVVGVE